MSVADIILDEELDEYFPRQILPEWEKKWDQFLSRDLTGSWSMIRFPHMLPIEKSPLDTPRRIYSMVGRGNIRYYTDKNLVRREKCYSLHSVLACPKDHYHLEHLFCMAWDCPRCWPLASMRAGLRIQDRAEQIMAWAELEKFYHFTISFDPDENILDYKRAYEVLHDGRWAFLQGAIVFRHFHRLSLKNGVPDRWRWSPHFHVITDSPFYRAKKKSWIKGKDPIVRRLPRITGKPLALALYEMGHSGYIFEQEDVITGICERPDESILVTATTRQRREPMYRWWGRWAYNQWTKTEVKTEVDRQCEECQLAPLRRSPPNFNSVHTEDLSLGDRLYRHTYAVPLPVSPYIDDNVQLVTRQVIYEPSKKNPYRLRYES